MLLIETIRICNRHFENIERHNERLNKTRKELFSNTEKIDLKNIIKIPVDLPRNTHKCRVLYDDKIRKTEFIPYQKKIINHIKLVTDNNIEYQYKYADRSKLQSLMTHSNADEIMIIKNGFITDASYANLCFFDGEKWLTPSTPLLPGTMRAKLLSQGKIQEADIRPADLRFFKKIKLINAMLGCKNSKEIEIGRLIP